MLQARLKRLTPQLPVLAASFVTAQRRCGKASCCCSSGGPRHTAHQVTFQRHGKSCSVYVPKDLVPDVQAWIAEHHRIKRLLHEINQLTLALIRTHARHQKRKQGRS
jgi:hypothetical protein